MKNSKISVNVTFYYHSFIKRHECVIVFHRYSMLWHHAVSCQNWDGYWEAVIPSAAAGWDLQFPGCSQLWSFPHGFWKERRWHNHGLTSNLNAIFSMVRKATLSHLFDLIPLIPFISYYLTLFYNF